MEVMGSDFPKAAQTRQILLLDVGLKEVVQISLLSTPQSP